MTNTSTYLPNADNTVAVLLSQHSKALQEQHNLDASSARIEVQCLLQEALQKNRAYLLSHPEYQLNEEQDAKFGSLMQRRLKGEPIAYLLGTREFFGLSFNVSPATLIPRPETELLVELALQHIPNAGAFRVLDLGTGSGAIALSIAHGRANTEIVAVDSSTDALEVARRNTLNLNINNIRLLQSDWFAALSGEYFDLIVANPPYIAENDAHLSQGDVRFEPRCALVSGADGLDDIRHICSHAKSHLNPGTWLLLEHGYNQAAQVRSLMHQAGFTDTFSEQDLSGIKRVSGGRLTSKI